MIRVPQHYTAYALRHGGASDDRVCGLSLLDLQRRGRWKSSASVRRYEKSGMVHSALAALDDRSRAFCQRCAANLELYMSDPSAVGPLP